VVVRGVRGGRERRRLQGEHNHHDDKRLDAFGYSIIN
jgi:hypothetical protein